MTTTSINSTIDLIKQKTIKPQYDRICKWPNKQAEKILPLPLTFSINLQWRHQGEMGAFAPRRRLSPSPLVPQSEEKKWPKSAIFNKFLDFCPSESHFAPSMPHKKIMVLPLLIFYVSIIVTSYRTV